jgi:hypothetical protein
MYINWVTLALVVALGTEPGHINLEKNKRTGGGSRVAGLAWGVASHRCLVSPQQMPPLGRKSATKAAASHHWVVSPQQVPFLLVLS